MTFFSTSSYRLCTYLNCNYRSNTNFRASRSIKYSLESIDKIEDFIPPIDSVLVPFDVSSLHLLYFWLLHLTVLEITSLMVELHLQALSRNFLEHCSYLSALFQDSLGRPLYKIRTFLCLVIIYISWPLLSIEDESSKLF